MKDVTLRFPLPQQPLQQGTEEGHRRAKGKHLLSLSLLPVPTEEPNSPLTFATEVDSRPASLQRPLSLVLPSQYNLIVHFSTAGWISSRFKEARKSYQLYQKSLRKVRR